MTQTIAFIGLGVMGYPMAGHLNAQSNLNVRVYNRTPEKAQHWAEEHAGKACKTSAEAVSGADAVVTCVGADRDLEAIYQGQDGILAHARNGAVLIDHTTASAGAARTLAQAADERGLLFVDAPVSGGQKGAESGQLTIMCGGTEDAFARAEPLMGVYGKAVNRMGDVGAGQLTKCVNQITVAGLLQGLSEGLHFAEQAGLDTQKVVDVISQGAAQSWQMDNRAETMISGQYDHGFAVDWMRKDLNICLQEAREHRAALPVTALVDQFYQDVQALGGGRWDTSSLLERLRENSG